MHKTIIYTDSGPPNLPPKDRTIIEVVESRNDGRHQTNNVQHKTIEKKSIETQTDYCELDDDEDFQDEEEYGSVGDSWHPDHVTSVQVFDTSSRQRRSRGRRRDSTTSLRSRSVPSKGDSDDSDREHAEDDWDYCHQRQGGYGMEELRRLEPELQHEISWSVAQLRAMFGESHKKEAKAQPPTYCPPPPSARAPITSYHLGVGDAYVRKTRPQSTYGEESYV